MATEKQIAANRANGRKSKGPTTVAGKSHSRRNSYKHGLLSRELILDWEEEREYRKLLNALIEEYRPEGATESLLVEQMSVSAWKQARLTGIERAMMTRQLHSSLNSSFNPGISNEEKFSHALAQSLPTKIQVLLNYGTLLGREFHRALRTLQDLQKRRESLIEGEAEQVETMATPEDGLI